jgi:hypothetical protein
MKVYKFGGASVKNADGVRNLAHIVEGEENLFIIVSAMGKNNVPYYPVGIVLMNNVNDGGNYSGKQYDFEAVVKEILLLNNKYPLQYNPNFPPDYKPDVKSAAPSYASGMDTNDSAFGWD